MILKLTIETPEDEDLHYTRITRALRRYCDFVEQNNRRGMHDPIPDPKTAMLGCKLPNDVEIYGVKLREEIVPPNPYQERVRAERDELAGRLERITNYLNSEIPENAGMPVRTLLLNQKSVMSKYLAILNARIENF